MSQKSSCTKNNQGVCIPNELFQSNCGRYFVGQSGLLIFGQGEKAWAGLVNPRHSGVNIFIDVTSISNLSNQAFTAQTWVNTKPPGDPSISTKVTPTNTSYKPLPEPSANLEFAQSVSELPSQGVNPFGAVIPSNNSVVRSENGKYIIPPGGTFVIFLKSPGTDIVKSEISFGWWERKVCSSF